MGQPFDPRVQIGHVRLRVADLDRSLAFYAGVLGFHVTGRSAGATAFLGAGGYHYHLSLSTTDLAAAGDPAPARCRFGIRYPDRAALADARRRLDAANVPLQPTPTGDGGAVVVLDPDANEVELYWDPPPSDLSGELGQADHSTAGDRGIESPRGQGPEDAAGHAGAAPGDEPSATIGNDGRQRLRELRANLLELHKVLLDDTRAAYELDRGRVGSPANLLQLVIHDPWFAWLRDISELVVRLDEIVEDARASSADAVVMVAQVEQLLTASETGDAFARRYYDALQRQPAVVLAHAEVRRTLKTMR